LIISALILVLYHDQGTIAGLQSSNFAGLMASVALLIWIGSSVLRDYSGKYGRALKDLTTWTGITLILVTLYTFRIELMEGSERVLQQLMPAGTNS
jgi:aspartyl protease family protein